MRGHVVNQPFAFLLVQDFAEEDADLSEVVLVAGVVPVHIAAYLLKEKYRFKIKASMGALSNDVTYSTSYFLLQCFTLKDVSK